MSTQSIEELYKPLLQFVKNRVNNEHDAEDLTQEIFLKLAKSDTDKVGNLRSWVYTIARNTITDYYRKKKISVEEIKEFDMAAESISDDTMTELCCSIQCFVNRLPDDYRTIIELSELQGVPQKEVAEQLGINYTTVRSKVQRGRKKLKEIFGQCCNFKQGGRGSILGYEPKEDCNDC